MRIKPARYLLRFDDLCPTMSRSKWESFLTIISEYGLKPILAVIPDNQDPDLKIDDPDPQFWDRMRALQAAGAAIAMHGYRHLCASRGKSILGLHRNTEFAGVDEETQRTWIRAGLATLRAHGLDPRLFVAPRHGFDQSTLSALAAEGLRFLSDGFATRPFTRDNIVWIPQQLWEPIPKKAGLWTICLHPNTSSTALAEKLDRFVRASREQFVSFDDVLENDRPSNLDHTERLGAWLAIRRVHFHRTR
jgi:predicted deacetylase